MGLGNNRGNCFASAWDHADPVNHSAKFWDFTFEDMGVLDVPAQIDLVLTKTGHKRLSYVGHSQGTTQFFIAAQTPGLGESVQQKVNLFAALSPIAFLGNNTSYML